jgi:hypothetical protein
MRSSALLKPISASGFGRRSRDRCHHARIYDAFDRQQGERMFRRHAISIMNVPVFYTTGIAGTGPRGKSFLHQREMFRLFAPDL